MVTGVPENGFPGNLRLEQGLPPGHKGEWGWSRLAATDKVVCVSWKVLNAMGECERMTAEAKKVKGGS